MKRTLLDYTQNILGALNSDEVNSISDTPESALVAEVLRTTYYNILGRAELPEHEKLFQLTPSGTSPVLMLRPNEGVVKINWMKYYDTNPFDGANFPQDQFGSFSHGLNVDIISPNSWSTTSTTPNTIGVGTFTFTVASNSLPALVNQGVVALSGPNQMFGTLVSYIGFVMTIQVTSFIGSGTFSAWTLNNFTGSSPAGYKHIELVDYHTFIDITSGFNPSEPGIQTYTFQDFPNPVTEVADSFIFYYRNDRQPQYCTNIQNYYFLFDSFDNTQEAGLQASKTMVSGFITPSWVMSDTFVPDLDDWAVPLLLNEAKALAYFELKQATHPHAEREINRQWSALQKTKAVVNKPGWFAQLPNFGRSIGTGGYAIRGPRLRNYFYS